MPDFVGRTIGRYPIVARLGHGGMAEVYKAWHPGFEHHIAVKVMRSDLAEDEDFRRRFNREAQNVLRLRHQHIVRVMDFDFYHDMPYMTMEYIDGPTLKQEIQERSKTGQPFTLEEVGRLMIALCDAIDYAHRRGMVHRDLKPGNFMLTKEGQVLVLDFGIAKIAGATTQLTITGAVTGTPAYMSPEQGQGQRGDERSDIYSLGIVLYELVTGRVPYDADTPMGVIFKHIDGQLPEPREFNPDIPEALEYVMRKSLAKEPNDRYQSGAEFITAIREALSLVPGDTLGRNPIFPVAPGPEIAELDPFDPTFELQGATPALTMERGQDAGATPARPAAQPSPKRRLGLIGGIIGALVLMAVAAGFFVANANRGANATATAASLAQLEGQATQTGEAALAAQAAETTSAQALADTPSDTPTLTLRPTDAPLPTDTPDTEATVNALFDARVARDATSTADFAIGLTAAAPTPTDTPLATDTPLPTDTSLSIDTPSPTDTPLPTDTPSPTDTPLPANTPTPTITPLPIPPTNTPIPVTPTPVPTPTPNAPAVQGRIAVPIDNGLGGYNINVYSAPSGQLLAKIEGAHQPYFRGDGVKLLVNGEGGGRDNAWEVNGSSYQFEKSVSTSPTDSHPVYHPDGSRMAYGNPNLAIGSDGQNHPFLFVQCGVRSPQEEGDERCRDITFSVLVPSGQIGEIHGSNPVWTGNDLIVYKGCNTWAGGNSCGIYRVGSWANKRSSNGETPAKLSGIDGTDTYPTDAHGTSILYHDRKNDNWDVYLSEFSGGPVNLSNDPTSNDVLGAFSPDGQWVAFVSDRGGSWALWVVAATGGASSRLFDIPWNPPPRNWWDERISWGQ